MNVTASPFYDKVSQQIKADIGIYERNLNSISRFIMESVKRPSRNNYRPFLLIFNGDPVELSEEFEKTYKLSMIYHVYKYCEDYLKQDESKKIKE